MDHLPLKNAVPEFRVHYYGSPSYEKGDFWSFPNRQGWQYVKDISVFEGGTVDQLAALLQAWLFFGLVQEVTGEPLDQDRFSSRAPLGSESSLTTSALPSLITAWTDRTEVLETSTRRAERLRVYTMLQETTDVLWQIDAQVHHKPKYIAAQLPPALLLSLALVVEAFKLASARAFQEPYIPTGKTGQRFLRKLLSANGWCPSLIRSALTHLDLGTVVYVISLGPCEREKDHSECTEIICLALQTAGVRTPSHTQDCSNPCYNVEPDLIDIIKLIGKGSIPLLYFVKKPYHVPITDIAGYDDQTNPPTAALGLGVREYKPGDRYTAHSHVFGEGTGNTEGHYLPKCALLEIWQVLQAQMQRENGSSPSDSWGEGSPLFWMDTLCVPVAPHHQQLRNSAITHMRQIYQNAIRVLVLSPETRKLDSGALIIELYAKTFLSGWMQRLWTLQEGALNPCLAVVDGKSSALYDQATSAEQVRVREQRVLIAFKDRFASRKGDETICIATFLGLDPSPLLAIDEHERMPMLLQMMPHVPDNVLFGRGPRLERIGFGWCPQTLLAPYGIEVVVSTRHKPTSEDGTSLVEVRPPNVLSPEGLHTTLPAIMLAGPARTSEPVLMRDTSDFMLDGKLYAITLLEDARSCFHRRASEFAAEQYLALLLALPAGREYMAALDKYATAVLVGMSDDTTDEVAKVRYYCKIGTTRIDFIPGVTVLPEERHAYATWVLPPMQRWIVD
ncbi:hypothetical protein LTR78_001939 [Recurvomyces mirabilis]|uniref:Heterokaryon incompatibility domain-containing protein n=1 Tax=Recurvomyces mirabilis TaxID=574656 RepID=A0AAE0WUH5_9PEZI|nr:hypothetical protein LTR78_001939 [Recurvomyces mirabilis]KAK5160397.1 hypothetical protein LTS14_001409 [Recurvomyces mirabilis]